MDTKKLLAISKKARQERKQEKEKRRQEKLQVAENEEEIVEEEDKVIYTLDDDKEEFTVRKDGDTFVVEGKAVNRLMGRINIDDNESMYYFQKKLKELGIEDELKRQGICEGDYVKMLNWTFEWYQ